MEERIGQVVTDVMRRVMAPHCFPRAVIDQLQIQFIKGIMIHAQDEHVRKEAARQIGEKFKECGLSDRGYVNCELFQANDRWAHDAEYQKLIDNVFKGQFRNNLDPPSMFTVIDRIDFLDQSLVERSILGRMSDPSENGTIVIATSEKPFPADHPYRRAGAFEVYFELQ